MPAAPPKEVKLPQERLRELLGITVPALEALSHQEEIVQKAPEVAQILEIVRSTQHNPGQLYRAEHWPDPNEGWNQNSSYFMIKDLAGKEVFY